MFQKFLKNAVSEPYRVFFPAGIIYLIWGALLWLPQLWGTGTYPTLAHRYLMLNGFSASFIGGFLMTAVPRFSKTNIANTGEVVSFFALTVTGLVFAFMVNENAAYTASALQATAILLFISRRVLKRKENPPYSFVFIFVGLVLWVVSAVMGILTDSDAFKNLHYEGAIAAIILGVGGRLIPGLLGHVEIVQFQRARYETNRPFLLTVPLHFYALVFLFVLGHFIAAPMGPYLRAGVVAVVGVFYWRLYRFPQDRTALTWCIWTSALLILASFLLRAFWNEGGIHAAHSFFFGGTVLLTLLVATRVLQSHGPKDKGLENLKILYAVTLLIVLAGATRVSALLMPENYQHHLGYSSLILTMGVGLWAWRYLRFILA